MSERAPRLLPDFDGTLVRKFPKTKWQNWFKAGLPLVDHALNFLEGAEDAGLEIGDILSRRPERIRRGTTMHSMEALGLSRFFPDEGRVKLLGSEEAKAAELLRQREQGPVVMIDDYPNKIGKEVLSRVHGSRSADEGTPQHPLVLGAVFTVHQPESIASLVRYAEVSLRTDVEREAGTGNLYVPEANLTVVRLHPYSYAEGQRLAQLALEVVAETNVVDILAPADTAPATQLSGTSGIVTRAAFSRPPVIPG